MIESKCVNQTREYMKLRILSLILALGVIAIPKTKAGIVSADPALAGAVIAQTAALESVYKERSKHQNAIIVAETAINGAMVQIHKVENKMLGYLSNAQGALKNLYQLKRCYELIKTEIPENVSAVRSAIKEHAMGTAIATVASEEIKSLQANSATLFPLVAQLVTSGSYNKQNFDGTVDKKKVNLLDASERYYILNEVLTHLEDISTSLWLLSWQIQTFSLTDLVQVLTPDTWYNILEGEAIANLIIEDYKSY